MRGFVKPGSILRYGDKADFVMTLDGRDLKVHFDGGTQLPDTFTDAAPVRADGRMDARGDDRNRALPDLPFHGVVQILPILADLVRGGFLVA